MVPFTFCLLKAETWIQLHDLIIVGVRKLDYSHYGMVSSSNNLALESAAMQNKYKTSRLNKRILIAHEDKDVIALVCFFTSDEQRMKLMRG